MLFSWSSFWYSCRAWSVQYWWWSSIHYQYWFPDVCTKCCVPSFVTVSRHPCLCPVIRDRVIPHEALHRKHDITQWRHTSPCHVPGGWMSYKELYHKLVTRMEFLPPLVHRCWWFVLGDLSACDTDEGDLDSCSRHIVSAGSKVKGSRDQVSLPVLGAEFKLQSLLL